MEREKKHWFKPKGYIHLDMPLDFRSLPHVKAVVTNQERVARHAFKPLIHRCHNSPRYTKNNGVLTRKMKKRHIFFACHMDSQIYSYYSHILQEKYETWLKDNNIDDSVTAYRSIPVDEESNKCHLHFAKEVFEKITAMGNNGPVGVIVADISGFFDNLDHKLLKKEWCALLGTTSLPPDHYNIFKAVTHFSFVEEKQLFSHFKDRLIADDRHSYRSRKVSRLKYLKDNKVIAFCNGSGIPEIREAGLIRTYIRNGNSIEIPQTGIPQGLPISATLANIYMRSFDIEMSELVARLGGIYRRYSDDITIVVPLTHRGCCLNRMMLAIQNLHLEIQKKKTKQYVFTHDGEGVFRCFPDTGKSEGSINYLGLNFDGITIRLKSRSVSQHYDRLRRKLNSQVAFARKSPDEDSRNRIFENHFIYRFSKVGKNPYPSFKFKEVDGKKERVAIKSKKHGNYLSYVSRATRICESKAIEHQLSRNLAICRKSMANAKKSISPQPAPLALKPSH